MPCAKRVFCACQLLPNARRVFNSITEKEGKVVSPLLYELVSCFLCVFTAGQEGKAGELNAIKVQRTTCKAKPLPARLLSAVVKSGKMTRRFRQQCGADSVIDGHNEGDEPMLTQPQMYNVINAKVAAKDVVVDNYKKKLIAEGVIDDADIKEMEHRISDNYEMSANRAEIEKELKAD